MAENYKFIIGLSKKPVKELIDNEAYDAFVYEVIDKNNGGIMFGPFEANAAVFDTKSEANEIAGILKDKNSWKSVVVLPVDTRTLNSETKKSVTEAYSEKYGGDPQDFVSDCEDILNALKDIDVSKFGTHLAEQIVMEFISTVESQISMCKERYNLTECNSISLDELPDVCYVYLPSDCCIGILQKGECGYHPSSTDITGLSLDEINNSVCALNDELGVTKDQADAMLLKAMFGWGDNSLKTEEVKYKTITDIKDELESADSYDELRSILEQINNQTAKDDCIDILDGCEEDEDDIDICVSLIESDVLDAMETL